MSGTVYIKQSQRSQLERDLEKLKWQPRASRKTIVVANIKDLYNDNGDKDNHDYGS